MGEIYCGHRPGPDVGFLFSTLDSKAENATGKSVASAIKDFPLPSRLI
jgi:hypothetical protein